MNNNHTDKKIHNKKSWFYTRSGCKNYQRQVVLCASWCAHKWHWEEWKESEAKTKRAVSVERRKNEGRKVKKTDVTGNTTERETEQIKSFFPNGNIPCLKKPVIEQLPAWMESPALITELWVFLRCSMSEAQMILTFDNFTWMGCTTNCSKTQILAQNPVCACFRAYRSSTRWCVESHPGPGASWTGRRPPHTHSSSAPGAAPQRIELPASPPSVSWGTHSPTRIYTHALPQTYSPYH